MPIIAADLLFRLSVRSGTAGNQTVQANANLSLGRYMSTTAWVGGTLSDLFNPITGDANAAMLPDYRCVFVYNTHPTLPWTTVVTWLSTQAVGAVLAVGVDPTAASAAAAAGTQAVEVADATTAPTGVVFAAPLSKPAGVALGSVGPGQCLAVWFRRTPAGGGAVADDTAVVQFAGDTA